MTLKHRMILKCVLAGATGCGLAVAARAGGAFEGFEKPEDLPGAVSMIWTGREVLADVSGYADLATKRPVTTNDLFWIASNTKAIACSLMLLQIDKGLVRLDAPVADYLPEWKDIHIKGGKAPKHAPTVREVMGHTAGLAFFPKMPITQFSVQELAHMAVTNGLDHDVGEYLYSNWGIDVAMAVVERVTGKPWETSLKAEVLDPLGMKDTTFFPTVKDYETRMAKSYRFDPYNPKRIPGEMHVDQLVFPYDRPGTRAEAGGGLFATASDLLAFFRMVASRGRLPDGRQFISEKLMDEWYGLTDFYRDRKYTFGMDVKAGRGFVRHGGAYNTDGAANWKRGTARVFMTQISMWTARSVERRRNWEDYAAQWLDVGADRVWRNNIAWFGAKPDAPPEVNAQAIRKAIDECLSSGGAGEVTIPRGVFRTGAYEVPDGVTLKFEDGAKLERAGGSVRLMLPGADETVPLLTEGQRAFFALPDETRRQAQGNAATRAEWVALGWHPRPVTFVWDGFKTRKARIRFRIWREADDVCVCDTNFLYLTTGRFEWDNFRVGTAYRWGLDVKGKGSATSRFVTEDIPPRLIRVPGVPNLRDLGGWKTADGRRVRQGLLYRSANLCENAAECKERPPRSRMTPATCHYMTNALGISTELDLRSPRECEGLVVSPLGPSVRRVEISSGSYSQMDKPWAKEALLKALRLIADERSLPLLFHCSGGRDRTGTLAFIVNGLLGVSPEDLARDWDATALWDNERDWFNRNSSYAALLAVMDAYPGATLNERIEAYVKAAGFSDAEIAHLRSLLLQ